MRWMILAAILFCVAGTVSAGTVATRDGKSYTGKVELKPGNQVCITSAGQAVTEQLRALGHDVEAVAEWMPQALDDQVIDYAYHERRILVTNDRDFGDKVYREGRPHAGILLLRLADDRAATKVRVITALLAAHSDHLADRFVVVTERSIRIRSQP